MNEVGGGVDGGLRLRLVDVTGRFPWEGVAWLVGPKLVHQAEDGVDGPSACQLPVRRRRLQVGDDLAERWPGVLRRHDGDRRGLDGQHRLVVPAVGMGRRP